MAEWDQTFAVNVRAAAFLCAAVLPEMRTRGFGRIVNVGAVLASTRVPSRLGGTRYLTPARLD